VFDCAVASDFDKEPVAKVCESIEYQSWQVYIPENQENLNLHVNELFAVMIMDVRPNKTEREIEEVSHQVWCK
jgi:hypothetical protein